MTNDAKRSTANLFKVALVERTAAPDGDTDQRWHRYVLENGRSTIVGQRQGTLEDVMAHAKTCIEQLNARGVLGRSAWSPRGRKPAQAKT